MNKDKFNEKQFLDYLDRIMAGEPITLGDDVSDEVRTALDQARVLLSYRREPSAEFRAELKNKLLRQIAEKQVSTARESERISKVFPLQPVLVGLAGTAAVLFLAFIGVVWYSGRFGGGPSAPTMTTMAPPSAEYSVRLPANIVPEGATFTAMTSLSASPAQAAVYEIEGSQVTVASVTELGRKLGFTGQAKRSYDGSKIEMTQGSGDREKQLAVWTASGAVDYGYVEPEKLYPSTPPSLPSQSQAELIAYDFLQQADLLPPAYHSLADIKDETTVAAGGGYSVSKAYTEAAPPTAAAPSAPSAPSTPSEEPTTPTTPSETAAPAAPAAPPGITYWLVDFPYFVDGAEATGPGSKIEVSVGDNGEVVGMLWSWRQLSPLGTDNIISEQQAFQELTQGKGSVDIPLDCRQVVVEQVQLKYWLDPPSEEQDYAVPVYEFTGTCLDKNGNTLEDFTGWTPALSTN
jgi:hypothetical protein